MRDRSESILQFTCLILALLVLASLCRAGCRAGALVGAKIPAIPTLETNTVSTNSPAAIKGTNLPLAKISATNSPVAITNQVASAVLAPSSSSSSSSSNLHARAGTNALPITDTNAPASTNSTKKAKKNKSGSPMGMAFGGFPGMPGMGSAPKLPADIQTRVDKIVDSEIFAPVIHPQPMALLGIAGDTAFLRTASGQTGLVKAGEPLGDLKLLRIGINRVLVEQDGQKKELMIFDGYGGESLLPKDSPDSKDHSP